jgi:predicted nucleic acid-binding protein
MLVYLDTNVWVYAYENDRTFGLASQRFMQSLRSGKHRIAGSLFVLNELLVLPTRRDDTFTIASYRRLFAAPNMQLLPYTLACSQAYAQLRAFDGIKPLDALHLATAAAARVDLFVTHDVKLLSRTVPGIGAIVDTNFEMT